MIEKDKMGIGSVCHFIVEPADNPPTRKDNGGFAIGFVPGEGLQWCQYYNGSKSWRSGITKKSVNVTEWLRMHDSFNDALDFAEWIDINGIRDGEHEWKYKSDNYKKKYSTQEMFDQWIKNQKQCG